MTINNCSELLTRIQSQVNYIRGQDDTWKQVSFRMAIKYDGTLWSWGNNFDGSLGDGTATNRNSPGTLAGGGANWCQISSRFAIKTDGTLWTWGSNNSGVLGNETLSITSRCSPGTTSGGGTNWCQVSATAYHSSAIKTDGTLWTWGDNTSGRLGDGTTVSRSSPGTIFGGGTTWCQVSNSSYHNAAIKTDGTLWTWGCNGQGRLGDGTTVDRCSPGTIFGGGTNWCQVSIEARYGSAAIKSDGTLWTWGSNNSGQLGNGTFTARCSPGTVAGNWIKVSLQRTHILAIKCDGTLWTWGENDAFGRLGDGTTITRTSPVSIAGGGTTWCQVAKGASEHSVAIKTDGTIWTWGRNAEGQLGDGTTTRRCSPGSIAIQLASTPKEITLLSVAASQVTDNRQVSVASSNELPDIRGNNISNGQMIFLEDRLIPVIANNECWLGLDGRVLRSDAPTRTLFSWGGNSFGELGDGTTVCRSSPGTTWGSYTTWCQISRDAAIKTDGTLWTWGCNGQGQLGDGTTVSRCSPGTVFGGGTNWCQVVSSLFGTAAIKEDGTLWTWGAGISIGSNSITARCSPGTIAGGGTTWCQISAFNGSFAAIKTDGTLWTWGCNGQGRLGDGTTVPRSSPGTVAGGGTNWCKVTAGSSHAIAIKTDGTLWTWGCNNIGQLGEGTTVSRSSPGSIFGDDNDWCYIGGMGSFNGAAIKTDGTLWTWGSSTSGQLGDGTTVSRCSPGTVFGGGTTWCKFSMTTNAGGTAAIKTDGTLWTWGQNQVGLTCGFLGDGTTVARCSPGTIAGGGTQWQEVMFGDCFSLALKVS